MSAFTNGVVLAMLIEFVCRYLSFGGCTKLFGYIIRTYRSSGFFAYVIFFMCVILCGIPSFTIVTFGILTYRDIRKTIFLLRLRIDQQLTIVVFTQVFLTLIGLTPYTVYCLYAVITLDF
ncbi:unnamed protein product [Rotaria magnacalcarata]